MNKRYTNRTKRHKYRAQPGATIIIIIRQSSSSSDIALLHTNCARHFAAMTANFVEISNALEPT